MKTERKHNAEITFPQNCLQIIKMNEKSRITEVIPENDNSRGDSEKQCCFLLR